MRRALFFGTVAGVMGLGGLGALAAVELVACGSSFDTEQATTAPDGDAQMDSRAEDAAPEASETDAARAGGEADAADATSAAVDASVDAADAAARPYVVAVTNGPVTYLAANEQTVGWIESANSLRFASATDATDAGPSAGISLTNVTGFAMNNLYAYVGASGPGITKLQAYNFTSTAPVYSADGIAVTNIATVGDESVWDIGTTSGSIEMLSATLMGNAGNTGNGTGVNASQLFAAGPYLYYNASSTISVCTAATGCTSTTTRLFVVPKGTVLYAANRDANNANVFYFEAGQMYGCTYKPGASASGFGCTSPVPVALAANPGGLATNGGYVYWIDLAGSAPGVYRESVQAGLADGGSFGHGAPERIAKGDSSTANLTINSTAIFWSTATGSTAQTIYGLPQQP